MVRTNTNTNYLYIYSYLYTYTVASLDLTAYIVFRLLYVGMVVLRVCAGAAESLHTYIHTYKMSP